MAGQCRTSGRKLDAAVSQIERETEKATRQTAAATTTDDTRCQESGPPLSDLFGPIPTAPNVGRLVDLVQALSW